jgi:alanine racemase
MPDGFSPALSLYTVISEIKTINPGESIGYGASYTATRRMRVAILPIGYGEGYRRALSGAGRVLIKDKLCPIVGRICMNMTAVDITELDSASVGDTVTLIGGELSATALGEMSGTIGYEVLSSISKDIMRIYI